MDKKVSKISNKVAKKRAGRPIAGEFKNAKESILKAYLELCFTEGAAAATLQKVADKSGVALATVRYHFNLQGHNLSLDALDYGSEITYKWIDNGILKARSEAHFDPVKAYIDVMFDWIIFEPVQASYLIYFYYLSTTQVELPTQNSELVGIAQRRVKSFIHEGLGMKLYHFEGDVAFLSEQIHTIVTGGCIIALTTRNREILERQRQVCIRLASQLLNIKAA